MSQRKPSPEAAAAIRKICACPRVAESGLAEGVAHARKDLRGMLAAAMGYEFDLRDVQNKADREEGIEEALQKLGALNREGRKLNEQIDRVMMIARELDREIPRIAKQLGIDVTNPQEG